MQFKSSLIGAVIGGVIGVAALVAAYFFLGTEHTALAIVIALLVGLSVRATVATKGHASYVRGALTALMAIAAFVGGKFIVAEIAARQSAVNVVRLASTPAPPPKGINQTSSTAASSPANETAQSEAQTESQSEVPANAPSDAQVEVPRPERLRSNGDGPKSSRTTNSFSPWDFAWICVAALVAYELGRGSGTASPVAQAAPTNPA